MGKHFNNNKTARNAVFVAVAGVSAAAITPATAEAAPVLPDLNSIVSGAQGGNLFGDIAPKSVEGFFDALGSNGAETPVNGDVVNGANLGAIDTSVVAGASLGREIANAAQSKVGAPYVWGAAGPNAFDCSGLTSWAYQQAGKSIPRTSSAQASSGVPVSLNALQPGDIISYYSGASHVGIYIGGGKIVHALNESSPVRVDDLNFMPINNAIRF